MDMDQKPIVVCEICNQRFPTMSDLKRHILELCSKGSKKNHESNFQQETNLHILRRNDDTRLPKRSTKEQTKLFPSLPVNIDHKTIVCEICKLKFQSIQDLKRHILSVCRHQLKRTNKQSNSSLLDVNNRDSIECNGKVRVKTESANGSANAMHVNDKARSSHKKRSRETVKFHGRTMQYVKVHNETIRSAYGVLQCDTTKTGVETNFNDTSIYSDSVSCETMHCSNKQSFGKTVKCAKTDKLSIGEERVALNLNRTPVSQNCHQGILESSDSQTLQLNQLVHKLQDGEHFTFQIRTKFVGINIVMIKDKSVPLNDEWNYHCLECKECFYDEADLIRHDCMERKSNNSKDDICRCADCKNLCKSPSSSKQMQICCKRNCEKNLDSLQSSRAIRTKSNIVRLSCHKLSANDLKNLKSTKSLKYDKRNPKLDLVAHKETELFGVEPRKFHVFDGSYVQKISHTYFDIRCKSCLRQIGETTMLEHVKMNHSNRGCKALNQTNIQNSGSYGNICKIHFKNKYRFRQHFVSNHKSYECEKCDRQYDQYRKLMEHVRCKHTEHTKLCHVCGKMFHKHNVALKLHLESHDLDRPKCDHCQQTFTQLSTLRMHITLHFGGPKFECKTCKRSFRQFQNLKRHEKQVHTSDRPYRCDKCGFGAVGMSKLKRHMLIHNKIKQFQCTNCGTTFRWGTNLNAHIRNGVCKKSS